jgi:hypothetical protein
MSSVDSTPEKTPDDSSKLKTFLGILRKYAPPRDNTGTKR